MPRSLSAEPRDGAVVAKAPKKVELRFNESVMAGAVNLIDATGKLRGDATVDAKRRGDRHHPAGRSAEGTQIVSYRVISEDGHPVSGSITFSIGAPTANNASDNVLRGSTA